MTAEAEGADKSKCTKVHLALGWTYMLDNFVYI